MWGRRDVCYEWKSVVCGDQEALSSAIQGKGAFRRFKDSVYQMGFNKKWYAFQAEAFKRKAARWCEENDIEYEE